MNVGGWMPAQGMAVYDSGGWEINLPRRELRSHGQPIPLGGRAFDIVEVLAVRAGELVTKDDLMSRVWPGTTVGENTLHVHAVAIRKALGPDRWMLQTTPGRGYRLLGDWTVRHHESAAPAVGIPHIQLRRPAPETNFPVLTTRLVGRQTALQQLRDAVTAYRVVTLTGPGGIGKTMLALQTAHHMIGEFPDGGWLVELAALTDPNLVPSAVAQVLGLTLGGAEVSTAAVARAVGTRKLLLLLDNCEHVIDAAAQMADTLMRLCPHVTVLTTSREILRVQGEYVYRVRPLEVPAEQVGPDEIVSHSAPHLFIIRAEELGSLFASSIGNLRAIATICRQLDGIPLAIEFAAARAAVLGIEQVASGLRERFAFLTSGRRTALPRHRTLRATLEWSYELLREPERALLLRLAIFAAAFSLDAAIAVASNRDAPAAAITNDLANLVIKSMVAVDNIAASTGFRLLETTRVFALEKLIETSDQAQLSRRHAKYYANLLQRIESGQEARPANSADLGNVRAALEWCFGPDGDPTIGAGLVAAAAPTFLAMSLLTECHR